MHAGEGIFVSNRAFFSWTRLFCVKPCILLSNQAFLCRTSVIILVRVCVLCNKTCIYRQQRVVINGQYSAWRNVTSDIPQDSVQGPLLFMIYINDLPDTVLSQVILFADDTKMYPKSKMLVTAIPFKKIYRSYKNGLINGSSGFILINANLWQ